MPIFYKITTPNREESYLLGTIHLSESRIKQFSIEQVKAFQQSTTYVCECLYNSEKHVHPWESEHRTTHNLWYANPLNLAAKLKEVEKRFPFFIPKFLITLMIKELSPFYLARTVAMLSISNIIINISNMMNGYILDDALYIRAKNSGKAVVGLEDIMQSQSAISASNFSYEEQLELSKYYIENFSHERYLHFYKKAKQDYLQGDFPEQSDSIFVEGENHLVQRYNKGIKDDRDAIMIGQMEQHLRKGKAFIAVGAAHLTGIIRGLRNKGYQIDAIKIQEKKYPILDFATHHDNAINITKGLFIIGTNLLFWGIYYNSTISINVGMCLDICVIISSMMLLSNYLTTPAWPKASTPSFFKAEDRRPPAQATLSDGLITRATC